MAAVARVSNSSFGEDRVELVGRLCHLQRLGGAWGQAPRDGERERCGRLNEAILKAIEEHALTPEAVEQVVSHTERDEHAEKQAALAKEQRELEKRIARLVAAVETGGDVLSIAAKLRELEKRQEAVVAEMDALRPLPRLAPSVLEDRLSEWRRLLRQSTTQGRIVLQRVLQGRITFTPSGNGYYFEAPTRFDRLFAGVAAPPPEWIEDGLTGTEHIRPEDTPDADYGALLARAQRRICGKGVTSPAGVDRSRNAGERLYRALTVAA